MYIVELIAISLDRVSMDVDGGFEDRFDGGFSGQFNGWFNAGFYSRFDDGFDGWFNLLCWASNLSEALASSDNRLNELVVLQTHFTGFVKQTRCFTGSLTAFIIVTRPYRG
jgi:hypothetical protein